MDISLLLIVRLDVSFGDAVGAHGHGVANGLSIIHSCAFWSDGRVEVILIVSISIELHASIRFGLFRDGISSRRCHADLRGRGGIGLACDGTLDGAGSRDGALD